MFHIYTDIDKLIVLCPDDDTLVLFSYNETEALNRWSMDLKGMSTRRYLKTIKYF